MIKPGRAVVRAAYESEGLIEVFLIRYSEVIIITELCELSTKCMGFANITIEIPNDIVKRCVGRGDDTVYSAEVHVEFRYIFMRVKR